MSDIYVHLKAARSIYEEASPANQAIISTYRNAYNLGAQGPDIFFYHRTFPWTASSRIKRIGTRLHSENINSFFLKGFKMISLETRQKNRNLLTAYFFGFLTHYSIDVETHPYIFYFSGHDGGYNHKYLECLLDSQMRKMSPVSEKPSHKRIKLLRAHRQIISTFMHQLILDVYQDDISIHDLNESMTDMVGIQRLMYDPFHIKKPILKLADRLTGSNGKIKTAIFPRYLKKSVDFFNLDKKTWHHPSHKEIGYDKSYLECVQAGETFGGQLIAMADDYMAGRASEETFAALLQDLGYDTGLRWDEDHTMKYSKPIVNYKQ